MKKILSLILILLVLVVVLYVYFRYNNKKLHASRAQPIERVDHTPIPGFYFDNAEDVQRAIDEYLTSWRMHFIDVGQGDAILIQGYRKNILIDGGERSSSVTTYLESLEIDTLHWIVATHPHSDHIAGLVPVFRRFPVLNVIDNGFAHSSDLYRTYRMLVDSAARYYHRAYAGWNHTFHPDFEMVVLHPDTLTTYGINDASVVLEIKMGDMKAILTGDIEKKAERAILRRNPELKANLVKISHHGSKTSSSKEFLEVLSPSTGIILCGHNNKYGFPHSETLQLLDSRNTRTYRSDLHGNIIVLVNNEGYRIFPEREEALVAQISVPATHVDINRAELAALIKIIHIGESTARAIVENRPFNSLDDLVKIKGIGERKLDDIKLQGIAVCNPG
jgi:competence protein ComEC